MLTASWRKRLLLFLLFPALVLILVLVLVLILIPLFLVNLSQDRGLVTEKRRRVNYQ